MSRPSATPPMVRVGLALGGGGARGAAHLGVLQVLEQHGLRPDLITGTSFGGAVGALLAAGLSLERIEALLERFSLSQLFSLSLSSPSITDSNKIQDYLASDLGGLTFADLQIPLSVVAVNLVSRREVVLDDGDVLSAVMATMAFPVLLPPVRRRGLDLVDGGLLNNVPFDVARARGATHIIAVDLSNTAPYGTPVRAPAGAGLVERALAATQRRRIWQVLSTVTDIISAHPTRARLALAEPDLLLRPDMGTIGLFDFARYREAMAAGRAAAEAHDTEIAALAEKQRAWREAGG